MNDLVSVNPKPPLLFPVPDDSATGEGGESYGHLPVLPEEVVAGLRPAPGKVVLDATLGGGGHAELFLEAGATVRGVDRDPEAIGRVTERLKAFGERFEAVQGDFRDLQKIVRYWDLQGKLDGLFADLGVSSYQLDQAERGFSFQKDGPLDMRMDPTSPLSARDIVNDWAPEELTRIFFQYGEEPRARAVARAIVQARESAPIETTTELARLVEKVIYRKSGRHPATRIFQALRIAVNDELGALETLLEALPRLMAPGGRVAILAFHSLEDRRVKRAFRNYCRPTLEAPNAPEAPANPDYFFEPVFRKAVLPSEEEARSNPRARSARLRIIERRMT